MIEVRHLLIVEGEHHLRSHHKRREATRPDFMEARDGLLDVEECIHRCKYVREPVSNIRRQRPYYVHLAANLFSRHLAYRNTDAGST